MKRVFCFLVVFSLHGLLSPAGACAINEIQRFEMRNGFCSQGTGLAAVRGCTRLLMRMQIADQFEQIALARRCGFDADANKLDEFYKKTTPLVIKLYECVDDAISQPEVEKEASAEVDKKLAALAPGCPDDLKKQMQTRLPSLLAADEKSLKDIQSVAKQIALPN